METVQICNDLHVPVPLVQAVKDRLNQFPADMRKRIAMAVHFFGHPASEIELMLSDLGFTGDITGGEGERYYLMSSEELTETLRYLLDKRGEFREH